MLLQEMFFARNAINAEMLDATDHMRVHAEENAFMTINPLDNMLPGSAVIKTAEAREWLEAYRDSLQLLIDCRND